MDSHSSSPRTRSKSASRLARTSTQQPLPTLSLDLVTYSPTNTLSPKPHNPISLHDLLVLSPSPSPSPAKRSKPRLDISEEVSDLHLSRRRCKNRFGNIGSPRNSRRSRRRLDQEIRDDKDKDFVPVDDLVVVNNKVKKRRHSGKSRREKLSSCTSVVPSPKGNDDDYGYDFDRIGAVVNDLIMWHDVAKSTLWFGFGSLCFLSPFFTTDVSFSMLSLISQLGLLCLGVSFFSNMIAQRNGIKTKRGAKLKEEDVLRAARVVLPAVNFVISKAIELFSGEPSMTLKVAPWLLIGYEYGHIVTFKRLCAIGFFISFTGPKLYSLYSNQICKKGEMMNWYKFFEPDDVFKYTKNIQSLYETVENMKAWILEAWGGCSHKKIVAASALTVFWNLTSIKTRIFAAFMCLVIFRCYRQQLTWSEEGEEEGQQQAKTLTLVENVKLD